MTEEKVRVPDLPPELDLTEFDLPQYRVECYCEDDPTTPEFTITTFGTWMVEGNFLIVWDATGTRHGHRIRGWDLIKTTKIAPKNEDESEEKADEA
jgi:hypothetical protein